MFKKFTNGCVSLVQKYLPDPFIFAVLLTFFVLILGVVVTGQSPLAMTVHWSKGLWTLLAFSMQMVLVLVTGHALANAPSFKKGLKTLAKIPKSPEQAIILVTLISTIACWINWGFGLVIGAIFAKELAKEVKGVDYRLLIASAYSGFLVLHAGLSGSIPLLIAAGGPEVVKATSGIIAAPIPSSETLFSNFNLAILAVLLITLPLLNRAMHPDKDSTVAIDAKLLVEEPVIVIAKESMTPADTLENSTILSMLLVIMGFSYIIYYFINGGNLDLNIVNAIFLFLGVALYGTP